MGTILEKLPTVEGLRVWHHQCGEDLGRGILSSSVSGLGLRFPNIRDVTPATENQADKKVEVTWKPRLYIYLQGVGPVVPAEGLWC